MLVGGKQVKLFLPDILSGLVLRRPFLIFGWVFLPLFCCRCPNSKIVSITGITENRYLKAFLGNMGKKMKSYIRRFWNSNEKKNREYRKYQKKG